MLQGPLKNIYWHARENTLSNAVGPIDIADDDWLLLRHASTQPQKIEWDRVIRIKNSIDVLYNYMIIANNFINYHCRANVQCSVRRLAASIRMCMARYGTIVVQHRRFVPVVRSWAIHVIESKQTEWPFWATYTLSNLRLVVSGIVPWKRSLKHVQAYVSQFDATSLLPCLTTPSATTIAAQLGLDMIRLPINLNYGSDRMNQGHITATIKACKDWIGRNAADDDHALSGIGHLRHQLLTVSNDIPHTTWRPDTLMDAIANANDEVVITSDDKDDNILWLQLGPYMMSRWISQMLTSQRWITSCLDLNGVLNHDRKTQLLPTKIPDS